MTAHLRHAAAAGVLLGLVLLVGGRLRRLEDEARLAEAVLTGHLHQHERNHTP